MLDLKHCFVAEKVPAKREFMMRQFELPVVVEDAAELSQPRSWNLQTGAPVMLEWPGIFGGGFSCKGKSKQNNNRGNNRSCIADGQTCTGVTFEYCKRIIIKMRPKAAFLENAVEVALSYEQDGGLSTSDEEYIVRSFEEDT